MSEQRPPDSGVAARTPSTWRQATWIPFLLLGVSLLGLAVVASWPGSPAGGILAFFQPGRPWTAALVAAAWTATLVAYAWPRRHQGRPFGVIVVVGLATLAVVGGLASFLPRSGSADLVLTPIWRTLRLFTGDPAEPLGSGDAPVALQVARFAAVAAIFSTAALAAVVLWRRQITRVRMRFVTFSDLVVGADEGSTELVKQLVTNPRRDARRPIGVVLRPGTSDDVMKDLTASGALVAELDASQPRFAPALLTFMTRPSWRRPRTWLGPTSGSAPAVDRIYVVADDPDEATRLAWTVRDQLEQKVSTQDTTSYIQVVVGVDDIDTAQAVRMRFLESPARVAIDAVSAVEVTAAEQVGRILREVEPRSGASSGVTLVVCGDTPLTRAVLAEVDRRAREQEYLRAGPGDTPYGLENWDAQPERQAQDDADLITRPFSIRRVVVVDELASSIRRQRSREAFGAADNLEYQAVEKFWPAAIESTVEALASDGPLAVLVTAAPDERSRQVAARVASQKVPVWVRTDGRAGSGRLGNESLHEYRLSLLFAGWLPETTWTRIARLKHERYRRRHFPSPPQGSEAEPLKETRLPWWHGDGDDHRLPRGVRDDNVAQVRRLMDALVKDGYAWQLLGPREEAMGFVGCFYDVGEKEHERWVDANCTGTSAGDACAPWPELDDHGRRHDATDVNATLHALAVHGFRPIAPTGAVLAACQRLVLPTGDVPACATCDQDWMESGYAYRFRRTGEVTADQLADDREWTTANGDVLHGRAGDWLVTGPEGRERTVGQEAFAASYEPVDCESALTRASRRYRRTGLVRARRATEGQVVQTLEGPATAQAGDWLVTRLDDDERPVRGDTWPVPDEEFQSSYVPVATSI